MSRNIRHKDYSRGYEAVEEYDEDYYRSQDLRWKIEEGRRIRGDERGYAPSSSHHLKSSVNTVSHLQQQQQQRSSPHIEKYNKALPHHSSHHQHKSRHHESVVQSKHKDEKDKNYTSSKKMKIEAETTEIISDEGSNDDNEEDYFKADEKTDSNTTKEEGEERSEDEEDKTEDSSKPQSRSVSRESKSTSHDDRSVQTDEDSKTENDTDAEGKTDTESDRSKSDRSQTRSESRSRSPSPVMDKYKNLIKERILSQRAKASLTPEVKPQTPPMERLNVVERFIETEKLNKIENEKQEKEIYNCALYGCRSVEEFECLNKIEEGAYGVVYRAKDKKSEEIVALKRLKMEKEREGFPITSLREVDTLLKAQHPNVVTVREIVVGSNMDKIYLVMDYVEHDLKSLMTHSMKKPFLMGEVKTLMLQILSGIAHLHDNWIIHRDLKTSNLLLSHKGVLKIADFGLAREYGSPLKEYTPIVVTLWYRCVELLLGAKKYSTAIDIWSVGCIFGEMMTMKAIFQGKNEKDQLDKIFKDLGTPNEKIWPGYRELPLVKKLTFPEFPYNTLRSRFGSYLSDSGFDLLIKFLTYDPSRRISAEDALKHNFFRESPLPIDMTLFPSWPAKSEGMVKKQIQDNEPKAPSAGKMFEKLLGEEEGFQLQMPVSAGFHLK